MDIDGERSNSAGQDMETLNLVVVGDTGVGKTNLLLSYATD